MESYYVALGADKCLTRLINDQKSLVKKAIGEQKYLSDPSHLTLYLFKSENIEPAVKRLKRIAESTKRLPIKIKDFCIFYNDIVTGGHTIAYGFNKQETNKLKKIQLHIADSIKNLEDSVHFLSKTDKAYRKMSEKERLNIDEYGFPFIGKNWTPHITIASIAKPGFKRVFTELEIAKIHGDFLIESLNLYQIKNSVLIKKFNLKS